MAGLKPEVAKKYRMKKGYDPCVITTRPPRRTVDLTKITLKQADELVASGFEYLVPIEETKEAGTGSRKEKKEKNDSDES